MSAHEENMVRITDVEERVVHWVLAASCLFCIITGVGLMFHSWSFIPTLLGGHYAAKLMHIYSGLIFGGMLVYSYYLWKKDCEFEQPDLQWVLKAGGYLWPVKDLPPVYKYNAGQKAFFWCLIACGIVIVVTGLFMWLWNPAAVPVVLARIMYMLHAGAVVVLAAFIMIHIYLGTAGNPGTVSAMITGYVSKAWCQTHCPRWYADRGKKDDETKIA
ncbi:MAG TPA: formate dehydrogenase subunit gamma [Deltaproteobacteria bacterium]|nr:MAG: Formate dehydrogenase, cytochrome b556(fdo) subunit [Deltaproteobacteria bacterium ADurb.Bin072]HNS90175.1 formate dehydrogenase subunit gamma [Deltaproteobacteria bacterium]HPA74510.1 formate dehydrogenase subunit gamma [Deltaproteobacteria bacterium]HPE44756.1 formate dehydrogenase subunit gamma [Deltaproteobacteria bacterium]HPJ08937.1 formate dehydrogenase subunit gamma [Deltaproteobacteria bacterium]